MKIKEYLEKKRNQVDWLGPNNTTVYSAQTPSPTDSEFLRRALLDDVRTHYKDRKGEVATTINLLSEVDFGQDFTRYLTI